MQTLLQKAAAALLFAALLGLFGSASPLATPAPHGGASADMVSVIVTLEDQATLAGITGTTRAARVEKVVNRLHSKADATQTGLHAVLEAARRQGTVGEYQAYWIFNGFAVTATPKFVAQLARRPEVLKITADATIEAPLDTAASTPEANIALVRAPDLWALGFTGGGVVVASMDTGVQGSHPDLAAQWRGGTNSWFDPNGQHPTTPTDMNGHGTRTMGVMVGRDGGGTAVGVAPDAQWIAVKIFDDSGTATTARVHQGFQWLLDPDGNPATPDAPDVVNNSWTVSGKGCNLEYQLDLQALRAADIIPVFAAGNYGPSGPSSRSPANNPEAFSVGATTNADAIWAYSSRGPSSCADTDTTYPELVAPGVSIRTTDRFSGYVTTSGTSLAAPHVTGALALLLDAHGGATAAQLETAVESTGVDLGSVGADNTFGYGRLDVLAAYNWLGTAPSDFTLVASPYSASTAQGGNVSYTVAVSPQGGFSGDVSLSVSGLPAGASASFDPAAVVGGGGTSLLTVSTSISTPAGSYPLLVTGTSGSLSHSALVTLAIDPPLDFTLSAAPASANAGQGGGVSYTVTVSSLNGFNGDVSLSVSGLPAGATSSFTPSLVVGGVGSSQLAVSTAATTPFGSYALTVTGSSGSLLRTTSVTLVVSSSGTTVFPSSTTIVTGTYGSGGASSLAADDSAYYAVNSTNKGQRTSAWYGTMTAVPNSLTSLLITYKGKNTLTCTQTVGIWNWASSAWLVLDSRSVGTSDVLIADLNPGGTLANFVTGRSGNGDVRVQIRCQTSSGSFVSSGNLMKIVFS